MRAAGWRAVTRSPSRARSINGRTAEVPANYARSFFRASAREKWRLMSCFDWPLMAAVSATDSAGRLPRGFRTNYPEAPSGYSASHIYWRHLVAAAVAALRSVNAGCVHISTRRKASRRWLPPLLGDRGYFTVRRFIQAQSAPGAPRSRCGGCTVPMPIGR